MKIYEFSVKTMEGDQLPLKTFRDKVLLIVNTACECGFTPQLEGLEFLWRKYESRGLQILAFPSDEFHQEPGSDQEIKAFCTNRYQVTFPILSKVNLNGDDACPLFCYLAEQKPFHGFNMEHPLGQKLDGILSRQDPNYAETIGIKWNFTKFIVDRHGEVIARLEPTSSPEELELYIKPLLENQC